MKKKIFVFNNGGSPGWYNAMAICEDGVYLAGHVCSHPAYIPHDMGITSDWKHEAYNAHCGEGNWELELVEKPKKHAGLMAAYALNQKARAEAEAVTP